MRWQKRVDGIRALLLIYSSNIEIMSAADEGYAVAALTDMREAEVGKEVVVMTEAEIEEWKSYYKNNKNMEGWIEEALSTQPASIRAGQQPFVPMLASIALIRHDPEEFMRGYGDQHRWVLCFKKEIAGGNVFHFNRHFFELKKEIENEQEEEKESFFLPDGFEYVLQIKIKGSWKDWVFLSRSTRKNARFGLFAAREFPVNAIIGYYMGPSAWTSEIEGGAEPPDQYITTITSQYALPIRNNECKIEFVDPSPISHSDDGEATALYMGMHYINNACQDYRSDTSEYRKAVKANNAILVEDGSVKAAKKIVARQEILCGYLREEHHHTEKNGKKEGKRKGKVKVEGKEKKKRGII